MNISVIGLGYVGLPLAILAAKKGHTVTGVDIDKSKINLLASGKSYLSDVSDSDIRDSAVFFTSSFSDIKASDAVIICVPTPLNSDKSPNLNPLLSAISSVGQNVRPEALIVIESTVNPGVCDEVLLPSLENTMGVAKDNILLSHCPERINPGDKKWHLGNINRVIGANSKTSLSKSMELYQSILDAEIKPMGSLKEAEAVKVVENSFRDVNIALVNELAMSFYKLGIDLENVIDGASTKPFSFMPHRPGMGVGGHCIPVDPLYLISYARTQGFDHQLLKLARSVNDSMPIFTCELLQEALAEQNINRSDAKVAVLGLAYKPDVSDDRESPAYKLLELLAKIDIHPTAYDPHLIEKSSATTLEEALNAKNAVVITTAHKDFYDITASKLKDAGVKVVIDGRNMFKDKAKSFREAGISYKGIGI